MATQFTTGTSPQTGSGQVWVENANGEWEIANVTAPGVVLTVLTVGSGTFTAPPGSVLHKVIASGSGGGGGGADSDGSGNTGGGGGQGGGTCIKFYTSAAMGATASYTVGAGGAGGANTGGTGTAGADTTFNPAGTGATLTAAGGSGGEGNSIVGTYSDAISGGGAAGTATNGDVNIVGGSGGFGAGLVEAGVENNAAGGHGGASYWGGGGLGGAANGGDTDPGGNGKAYGSGGGGAACGETTSGVAGGDGEDGIIVIESYIRQSVLSPIAYDSSGNALLDLSTDDVVAPGSDNGDDLGSASARWNDLYLGGNLYIGGTGAANALDDYEEGTWTPNFLFNGVNITTNSGSYTSQSGYYRIIGKQVHVYGYIVIASIGSSTGSAQISLPFTTANQTNYRATGSFTVDNLTVPANFGGLVLETQANDARVDPRAFNTSTGDTSLMSNTNFGGDEIIAFSLSYMVD